MNFTELDSKIKVRFGNNFYLIDTWLVNKKRWLIFANINGIFYKRRLDCLHFNLDSNSIINKNINFKITISKTLVDWDLSSTFYNGTEEKVIVRDNNGFNYYVKAGNLLQNKIPSIASILNINKFLLNKFKLIHGNKYFYHNFVYTNIHQKIKIICPLHDEFESSIENHLFGRNCRKCFFESHSGNYKGINKNKDKNIFIYHFELENYKGKFYKIGLSNNPKRRLREVIRKSKGRVFNGKILETISGDMEELSKLEDEYHSLFKEWKINYTPNGLEQNGRYECYKW